MFKFTGFIRRAEYELRIFNMSRYLRVWRSSAGGLPLIPEGGEANGLTPRDVFTFKFTDSSLCIFNMYIFALVAICGWRTAHNTGGG